MRPRRRRGRRRRGRRGAERRHRLGDGLDELRDFGKRCSSSRARLDGRIDDAVRRILRIKFRAGLFDHPYVDQAKAVDPKSFVTAADRAAARTAAQKSMVLLKNDNATLPLDAGKKVAVIGPLGDDQHDMLGPWWGQGVDADAVSLYAGIKAAEPEHDVHRGLHDGATPSRRRKRPRTSAVRTRASRPRSPRRRPPTRSCSPSASPAGSAARPTSAVEIGLPGKQQELIDSDQGDGQAVRRRAVQRPAADPCRTSPPSAPAILEAWFPGIEAGNAIADVLFGKVNPGGKLPVSFPRALGQIPIYYNHEPTGRPCDVTSKYNSRYRDLDSCDPLYAFGFGLSYTTFSVIEPAAERTTVAANGSVTATVDVTNTGHARG